MKQFKLIIKDGKEFLEEQLTMKKPCWGSTDEQHIIAYEQNLASLKEYPVHPDYQGHWKEGQEVKEGEFEVHEIRVGHRITGHVVVPKQDDKLLLEYAWEISKATLNKIVEEEEEDKIWDELRELFRLLEGSDDEDWTHNKTEIKKRFTLTRKI